jgi:uncharacterized protein (TIGR03435 family)
MIRTVLILAFASSIAAVSAQVSPAVSPPPPFEVASVKPNVSSEKNAFIQLQQGGRLVVRNIPLKTIITWAYQLRQDDERLVGSPDWIQAEKFDIDAKAPEGVALGTIGRVGGPSPGLLILRAILAERFQLKMRTETREMPIYALVTANQDGRLGPKLTRSDTDCEQVRADRRAGRATFSPAPPGSVPLCAYTMFNNRIAYGDQPLAELADYLSGRMQRLVVDRTGLTGRFDFEVIWTPDQPPPADAPERIVVGGAEIDLTGGVKYDPNGPALLTALREQLGLKIESTRGPVDVFVIERVERPTPD